MQTPNEYKTFMKKYSPHEIGINLNIGHLNLASNAFDFDRLEFVGLIKDYMIAMELSHNNGIEDQHLPLQSDEWYWQFLKDIRFTHIYKILEFRNTDISDISDSIKLFYNQSYAV